MVMCVTLYGDVSHCMLMCDTMMVMCVTLCCDVSHCMVMCDIVW